MFASQSCTLQKYCKHCDVNIGYMLVKVQKYNDQTKWIHKYSIKKIIYTGINVINSLNTIISVFRKIVYKNIFWTVSFSIDFDDSGLTRVKKKNDQSNWKSYHVCQSAQCRKIIQYNFSEVVQTSFPIMFLERLWYCKLYRYKTVLRVGKCMRKAQTTQETTHKRGSLPCADPFLPQLFSQFNGSSHQPWRSIPHDVVYMALQERETLMWWRSASFNNKWIVCRMFINPL